MNPLCHRTIGPDQLEYSGARLGENNGEWIAYDLSPRWIAPAPRPCLGSRCAMWVDSELYVASGMQVHDGEGWCHENPYRSWPDPAAKEDEP